MSDSSPFGFGRFVPGFDFLQKLSEGSAATLPTMPSLASWVAPTVSVEEIDQRIRELKTVQFWLEQNTRALTATVQALEVQRMTLATLQGMNVAMKDLAQGAFQAGAETTAAPSPSPSPSPSAKKAAPTPEAEPAARPAESAREAPAAGADPMQWWGALTQQFQNIASQAMGDAGAQQAALQATREMTSGALKAAGEVASAFVPKAGEVGASAAPRKKAVAKKAPAKKAAPRKPRRSE